MVIHRLYREATKFYEGSHVKDISALNRDLRKVIMVDDDPAAFQLQPSNAIHIKPYVDAKDKSDSALEDLAPFLVAMVNEGVRDFPRLLRSFPSNKADDIVLAYGEKLASVKGSRDSSGGLGSVVRSFSDAAQNRVEAKDSFVVTREKGSTVSRVARPSEEGRAQGPLGAERKGGLWKR